MKSIKNFPNLTEDEFSIACEYFCQKLGKVDLDFSLRKEDGDTYVIIRRDIVIEEELLAEEKQAFDQSVLEEGDQDDSEDEFDPGFLEKAKSFQSAVFTVEYHILLSHIHSLPVLYFTMLNEDGLPVSLSSVYRLLVNPSGHKGQVEQDHPILGIPYFFVHPCKTGDVMMEYKDEGLTLDRYLQIWIGAMGGCAGLYLPAHIFASQ